jgi:hypothetical protein
LKDHLLKLLVVDIEKSVILYLFLLQGRVAPCTHPALRPIPACAVASAGRRTCSYQADPDCYREADAQSEYTENELNSLMKFELNYQATK